MTPLLAVLWLAQPALGFDALIPAVRGSPVRDTLAALEQADIALPRMSEGDQGALLSRVVALAEDGRQDDVARAAAYARLGRWTTALKSPTDKARALRSLLEALQASPSSSRARFRGEALESLAAAEWLADRDAEDELRGAVFRLTLDRSLSARERRCLERLNARLARAGS